MVDGERTSRRSGVLRNSSRDHSLICSHPDSGAVSAACRTARVDARCLSARRLAAPRCESMNWDLRLLMADSGDSRPISG